MLARPVLPVLLLLAGCAQQGGGQIPPVPVAAGRVATAPLNGTLRLPPGAGPHPAVILLHGCGGISRNTWLWADRVVGWGYAALVLDSFTVRGATTVCSPDRQRLVTRYDRAADVVAAVQWLQSQPGVDGGRIAVIGESHGGSTAATVALHPFADAMAGRLRGAVDYYGACRDVGRYAGLPLLALAGTADTWGDPAETCTAFKAAAVPGSPVEVVTYPDAVHGFDNPLAVQRRFPEGHPLQYEGAAAEDSYGRVRAFLARVLAAA